MIFVKYSLRLTPVNSMKWLAHFIRFFYFRYNMEVESLLLVPLRTRVKYILGSVSLVILLIFFQMSWINFEYLKGSVRRISPMEILGPHGRSDPEQELTEKNYPCIDRLGPNFNRVEDIFCVKLPQFIPKFKNPCFYDYLFSGQRQLKCLPYFYVIGMDKSGSTDLHSRMAKHPLVVGNKGSLGKETQFWSWSRYGVFNFRRGDKKRTLDNYMDMFALSAQMIQTTNITEFITGDATPMDLWDFRAWTMIPQNHGKPEPEVLTPHFLKYLYDKPPKLIVQLREPVERLYSDYIFLGYGKDPLQFHKHSLEAIDMMNNCLSNHSVRYCYFSHDLYVQLPTRIHLGCYSVFLREWFHVFPRSAFHITRTDEYENDMEGTLKSIYNFLDLVPLSEDKMAAVLNQTRRHVTRKKQGIVLPETQAALRKFYHHCNVETAELLNDKRYLWEDHYS